MTLNIVEHSPLQKYVFANSDHSIVVVCTIAPILDSGTPIDPETGDDLMYLGVADDHDNLVACGTFEDNPELIFR